MELKGTSYHNVGLLSTRGAEELGFDPNRKYDTDLNNFNRRSTLQSESSKPQLRDEMKKMKAEMDELSGQKSFSSMSSFRLKRKLYNTQDVAGIGQAGAGVAKAVGNVGSAAINTVGNTVNTAVNTAGKVVGGVANTAKGIAGGALQAAGSTASGALKGAAIGSIVPILGTAIGAGIGAISGAAKGLSKAGSSLANS